ncbi:MAG: hypothetical protein VX966_03135 [Chloroflexota bacterium]|nr:hypothetical protein [Chloroflexota bacterium]
MIYRNITSLIALTSLLIITLGCGIVSVDVDSDKLESEISEKTSKAIKFKEGILGNSDNTTDAADEAHDDEHHGDEHHDDEHHGDEAQRDTALPPHIAERAELWITERDLMHEFSKCGLDLDPIVEDLVHPLASSQFIVDGKVYNPPTPTIEEEAAHEGWEPTITLTMHNYSREASLPATIQYDVVVAEDDEVWDVLEEDLSLEVPTVDAGDSYSEQINWYGEEDQMRITAVHC